MELDSLFAFYYKGSFTGNSAYYLKISKGGVVMTNKRTFLITGLVFSLALVFGITTGAMAENIRIGVAAPYTGDLAG